MNYFASGEDAARRLGVELLHRTKADSRSFVRRERLAAYAADPLQAGHVWSRVRSLLPPQGGRGAVLWLVSPSGSLAQLPWAVGFSEQETRSGIEALLAGPELGSLLPAHPGARSLSIPRPLRDRLGPLLRDWDVAVSTDLEGVRIVVPHQEPMPPPGPPPAEATVFWIQPLPDELGTRLPPASAFDGVVFVASFRDHTPFELDACVRQLRTAGHAVIGMIAIGPERGDPADAAGERAPSRRPSSIWDDSTQGPSPRIGGEPSLHGFEAGRAAGRGTPADPVAGGGEVSRETRDSVTETSWAHLAAGRSATGPAHAPLSATPEAPGRSTPAGASGVRTGAEFEAARTRATTPPEERARSAEEDAKSLLERLSPERSRTDARSTEPAGAGRPEMDQGSTFASAAERRAESEGSTFAAAAERRAESEGSTFAAAAERRAESEGSTFAGAGDRGGERPKQPSPPDRRPAARSEASAGPASGGPLPRDTRSVPLIRLWESETHRQKAASRRLRWIVWPILALLAVAAAYWFGTGHSLADLRGLLSAPPASSREPGAASAGSGPTSRDRVDGRGASPAAPSGDPAGSIPAGDAPQPGDHSPAGEAWGASTPSFDPGDEPWLGRADAGAPGAEDAAGGANGAPPSGSESLPADESAARGEEPPSVRGAVLADSSGPEGAPSEVPNGTVSLADAPSVPDPRLSAGLEVGEEAPSNDAPLGQGRGAAASRDSASHPATIPADTTAASRPEHWVVHLSSFRLEREALAEVARLARSGVAARSLHVEVPGRGPWYRVVTSRVQTFDEARALAVRLRGQLGLSAVHIASRGGLGSPVPIPVTNEEGADSVSAPRPN